MSTISGRNTSLISLSARLETTERKLDKAGDKEAGKALQDLKDAGRELGRAADDLGEAASQLAIGVPTNLVISGGHFVAGTAEAGAGAMLAVAGGAGAVGEISANVFGRAVQLLGRALLGIGNEARNLADIGGRQYTTKDVVGDQFAKTWSQDLLKMSSDQFTASANSYGSSLDHLVGAAGNVGLAGVAMSKAAKNVLDAAVETLKAAKNGGDAGVTEIAEKSVELAIVAMKVIERAVQFAEQGVDAGGAALQAAGKALILAGNAVNSRRGTDTAVIGN